MKNAAPRSVLVVAWQWALPVLAVTLLGVGAYLGLVVAPREELMGDVYRIMFVHVPTAWVAMLAFVINFAASVSFLLKNSARADALAEATAEIGVLFTTLLLLTGSLWGRPTWGVYWTWDPRLTTAAIMWLAYCGYLTLRRFVDSFDQRAMWSAVVAVVIFVDIPLVWLSVKWWNSLHQMQSSPRTLHASMLHALYLNIIAFLVTGAWLTSMRYVLARQRQQQDLATPPSGEPT